MNERHVKRPVDSLPPDAQLEAVMTYHPWDAPTTDSDTGYRVNIEHQGNLLQKLGPGPTIYLRAVSGGWMERVAPPSKTILVAPVSELDPGMSGDRGGRESSPENHGKFWSENRFLR